MVMQAMQVDGLLCEYAQNPIGIDAPQPRLSWKLDHLARDQKQSAYRVLVASSLEKLEAGEGDKWDSGKVPSDRSSHVMYEGDPLQSREACYWKVQVWDSQDRASAWSQPASFEMGLLAPEDWPVRWFGIEARQPGDALLFRQELKLEDKEVARARAYICGLGYYELRVNGEKVGDHVLDPGWTEYSDSVLYVTYDVTQHLKPGPNAVGVILGNGWYGKPKLLFQLYVEFADGSHQILGTENWGWAVDGAPIVANSIYDGEVYDARLELPGWDEPGYNASARDIIRAQHVAPPGGVLKAQMLEPIKVVDTIDPVALTNPKPGVYVFDMGQNFAGWCRLTVEGPRGTEVTLQFAETLYEAGTVNRENLRSARATSVYILKGEGKEVYEPRFTYFGFRYVQMTGYPGEPTRESLQGCYVRSSVAQTGSFTCSNELINRIHRAIVWTEGSNLHSVPTDCPQRQERQGWLNDMTVRAEEAIYNFDIARLYTKWLRDIRDAQDKKTGAIPDTAPYRWGALPGDPVDCYLFVAWYTYLYYGDTRVLDEFYEGIQQWVDFLWTQTRDGVVNYTRYSDWCTPIKDCYPAGQTELPEEHAGGHVGAGSYPSVTPGILISTAYLHFNASLLAKIAAIVGKAADSERYAQIGEAAKEGLNRRFFDPETAQYATGSQGSNAMPLFLNLVPEGNRQQLVANLVHDIIEVHDGHLNTGNQCTKYMAEALTRDGQGDVVYTFVTQTTYPGWGFMLARGATTIWERWEELTGGGMNSHSHPMHGSIGAWFYKYLAGIQADPDEPGWARIHVRPYPVGDLTSAQASLETLRGTVAVRWERGDKRFSLEVAIPANSQATVSVPLLGGCDATVQEGGTPVWEGGVFRSGVPGVRSATLDEDAGHVRFEVGSGTYQFAVTSAGRRP